MKKMKMINIKFLILMPIVLFSCELAKKEEASGRMENESKEPEIKEPVIEEFDKFFERFGEDSIFQIARISFPISYYSKDIMDNKKEYVYGKGDFGYINFVNDNTANQRETDAFEPLIETISDTETSYIRRGIDNGIRIEYFFNMNENGEWFLEKIIDNSN
ncbi:MAG: hypothetical protein JXQ96_06390 [Cyclobacteriaceae bacterium]